MSTRIRQHVRGNVVGYVALFLVLTGGTAQALNGSNTVFSDDIVNRDVKTADLGFKSVTANRLAPNSVRSGRVVDESLTGADVTGLTGSDVTNGALTGNDLADDSLTGASIDESSLGFVPNAVNSQFLGGERAGDYKIACRLDQRMDGTPYGIARVNGDAPGFPSSFTPDPSFVIGHSCATGSGPDVEARRISTGAFQVRFGAISTAIAIATVDSSSGAGGTGLDDFATVTGSGGAWAIHVRDADGGAENADFYLVMF